MPDRASTLTIVFAAVFALIIGGATGFVTTFTHRGLPPWGLIAGLAIVAALVAGFRLVFASRVIAGAAALGVIGATAALTIPGAGGTAFVITDPIGYGWAFGPAIVSLIAIVWPVPASRRRVHAHRSKMET